MGIKKGYYYHQAKRIDETVSDKYEKMFLRNVYQEYRDGNIGDIKSAKRFETLEAFFMHDPFLYQRLKRDFEPQLAATTDMLVEKPRSISSIDYYALSEKEIKSLMRKLDSEDHVLAFDEDLYRFLDDNNLLATYFDADGISRLCKTPREPINQDMLVEQSRVFRHQDTMRLFHKIDMNDPLWVSEGVQFDEPESLQVQRQNELRKIIKNYKLKVKSYAEFCTSFPALASLVDRYDISREFFRSFHLVSADRGKFDAVLDYARTVGQFNRASFSIIDPNLYDFYTRHRDEMDRQLVEEGLFDNRKNALYILQFSGMEETHFKVGITNYNHAFIRQKNIKEGFTRKEYYGSTRQRERDREKNFQIKSFDIFYLGDQASKIEQNILDMFALPKMGYLTKSPYLLSEFIDISSYSEAQMNVNSTLSPIDKFEAMKDDLRKLHNLQSKADVHINPVDLVGIIPPESYARNGHSLKTKRDVEHILEASEIYSQYMETRRQDQQMNFFDIAL